jgi:hypothetical protein
MDEPLYRALYVKQADNMDIQDKITFEGDDNNYGKHHCHLLHHTFDNIYHIYWVNFDFIK